MNDETGKNQDGEGIVPATEQAQEAPIEGLMAAGERPARRPDLQERALAAAEAAIEDEPLLGEEFAPIEEEAQLAPPPSKLTRVRILRVLLACNLLLMGVMLAMPGAGTSAKPDTPSVVQLPVDPARVAAMPPAPKLRLRENKLYEQALVFAEEGKYADAVRALEKYVEKPDLPDYFRRDAYAQMAHYLAADGRIEESQACVQKALQLMQRSFLPEDLLKGAAAAEKNGNGEEMRRYYARFLLQQRMLPAELRKHVTEAYLKLGDSYRVEAERGEARKEPK